MLLEERVRPRRVPIYPRYTFGGDLWSLEVIDGSTIKPLIDEYGGRPLAPYPAYQQVLYGFPRGEFTADTTIDDARPADRSPAGTPPTSSSTPAASTRVWTPYGYSAVEQALDDGDLYLQAARVDEGRVHHGTSIAGLYEVPPATQAMDTGAAA
jgi:hypothetical protein